MEILGKATFTWLAAAFKSALFTKINILNGLGFNVVADDKTEIGKQFNKATEQYNDDIQPWREKLIHAKNEAEILECMNGVAEINKKAYPEFVKIAGSDEHPIVKAFSVRTYRAGLDNPEEFVEQSRLQFSDMEKSQYFQKAQKSFSNEPSELAKIGVPVTKRQGYESIKEDVSYIAKTYDVAFFDLPEGDHKQVFKQLRAFHWVASDFAKKMGMTNDCVGMQGQLGITLAKNTGEAGGIAHGYQNRLSLMTDNIKSNVFAHEWFHLLDNVVMENAERHIRNKYGIEMGKNGLVSGNNIVLPDDGSQELKTYKSMRGFVSNVLSKDVEALEQYREKRIHKEIQNFLVEGLGDTFFALPQATRDELFSPDVVNAVKNKMMVPASQDVCQKAFEKIKGALGDLPFDEQRLKSLTDSPRHEVFLTSAQTFNEIENYKAVGESNAVKRAKRADPKNMDKKHLGNSDNDNYYQSAVELIARYTEGQVYPEYVKPHQEGVEYSSKKDKNFEKFREQLIGSYFGVQAVREPEYPQLVQTLWDRQQNPEKYQKPQVKDDTGSITPVVDIVNNKGKLDKIANLIDFIKDKPGKKMADMVNAFQSIFAKNVSKDLSKELNVNMNVHQVKNDNMQEKPALKEKKSLKVN